MHEMIGRREVYGLNKDPGAYLQLFLGVQGLEYNFGKCLGYSRN